jgi:hypothetical protein
VRRGAVRGSSWQRLVFGAVVLLHVAALYWPRVAVEAPVTWTDKAVHVALFGGPAAAGLIAGARPEYLLAALALHAPVSELLQHHVLAGRSGDPADAVADLAGVVLGAAAVVVWRTRTRW